MRIPEAGWLFSAMFSSAVLAGTHAMAASSPARSSFDGLTGSFKCTSTGEPPYVESWSRPLGGGWFRATESRNGRTIAEHTVGYDRRSRAWLIFSAYSDGSFDLMKSDTPTSPSNAHAIFPAGQNVKLAFNRTSRNSYTVRVAGAAGGKSFRSKDSCSR